MTGPAAVQALQNTLAAEHAAVYVLSVVGAQTSESADPGLYAAVTSAFSTHRQRRDELADLLIGAGVTPVAADPAYDVPVNLSTSTRIRRTALGIERGCAAAYAYAIANTTASNRTWTTKALLDAADREIGFGGSPQAFPGL